MKIPFTKSFRIRMILFIKMVCVIICLLLSDTLFLFAQSPALTNYSTKEGLSSYETYMTIQDRNGYIWIATNYGVCRFDGYKFEQFSKKDGLPDNTIFELFEDSKGRIWFVASNIKFSYWDKGKIYQYKYNNVIQKNINFIPQIENRCFYVDDEDNLFFSIAFQGAFKVNSKGIQSRYKGNMQVPNTISLLTLTKNRYIYSSFPGFPNAIYYECNNQLKSFLYGSVDQLSYANKFTLITSNNKRFFAINKFVFNIESNKVEQIVMPDYIISLDEDKSNNIWVGLRNNGVLCFKNGDFKKQAFLHFLKGIPVSHVNEDRDGGFWFTTTTNGIFYTPSLKILNYTIDDGLIDNQVNRLVINNNEVAAFTRSNTYNIIANNKVYTKDDGIPKDEHITFVKQSATNKWIATNKSLYNYQNNRLIQYYLLNNNSIEKDKMVTPSDIIELDDQNIYFSEKACINKIKDRAFERLPMRYVLQRYTNLCYGNNRIIYFGSKIGPGYIDGETIKMLYDKFPELKTRSTFVLYNMADSSLWIATKDDGVYVLKDNKLTQISVKDGLCSNYVKHLCLGKEEIWASTNEGINRISIIKKGAAYNIKKINFTMGLISNDINEIVLLGDTVYAATAKGLSVFDSKNIHISKPKNKAVLITAVQINEKDTSIILRYELPHNIATIAIAYRYLSNFNIGNNNYRYRLIGLSDKWHYTSINEVRFTTLPPGEYDFEVEIVPDDNSKTKPSGKLKFIINKPFWETWWFIISGLMFIILIIYAIIKYQGNVIRKQNNLKNELLEFQRKALCSQMNPHFIFNSLNSIQLYILKNDVLSTNKYLTKFATLMRSILNNSQESVITLENEINTLTNYIELEALRFDNKFDFNINIDSTLDIKTVKMPSLLLQPFVENAIWHGLMNKENKGLLTITVLPSDPFLKCIIQDNGVGRKTSEEINQKRLKLHKSLGAKITQDRLNLLSEFYKNELKIIFTDLFDSAGNSAGTKVEITIPIINMI